MKTVCGRDNVAGNHFCLKTWTYSGVSSSVQLQKSMFMNCGPLLSKIRKLGGPRIGFGQGPP